MSLERSDIVRDQAGFETPDIHSSTPEYANRFSGQAGKWFIRVQEEVTQKLLEGLKPGLAIDVGGGHGQNIRILNKKNYRVTILGSNKKCANLIHQNIERNEVDFQIGPLTKIPFSDSSFDLVISYRILTHLSEWPRHIKELCRVSRNSVLLEYPVCKGFNALSNRFFNTKKKIEGNTRPYTLFRDKDIQEVFESQGYQLVESHPQFFWPMALHRLYNQATFSNFLEWIPRRTGLTSKFGSPVIARFDKRDD